MLKFFKYMAAADWVMFAAMIAFLLVQIWCDVTLPAYTSEIVSEMMAGSGTVEILATGGKMLAFAAGSICCTIAETIFSAAVSTRLGKRLRRLVFDKALALPASREGEFPASALLTRTTNDVQQVVSAMVLGMRLGIGAPVMAIWAIVRISGSGYELTLAMGAGVFVLIAGIMAVMFVVTPRYKKIQVLTDRINGSARDSLVGIRVIRAYNAEEVTEGKFDALNKDLTKTSRFAGRVSAAVNPLIQAVNYGLTVAVYWIGCIIIIRDNDMAFFPTLFSFSQLAAQVILAFMSLVMLFQMLPRAMVSSKRINALLAVEPDMEEGKCTQFTAPGCVEFKDVSFSYGEGAGNVIEHLSFKIPRGGTVAITGSTGCGKSTVIKLLSRQHDATEGEIFVGGVNIKELAFGTLRGAEGYVPQKSVLLSGSIRKNLEFGGTPAEEEMAVAVKTACADAFIEEKGGMDSEVSQDGANFSGGQKQRLSIARAAARRPDIFLLDDCFSALDNITDANVRRNLEDNYPDSTKIIASQRVGTVCDADLIIVLDDGKVAGTGTHAELLRSCPVYAELARLQLGDGIMPPAVSAKGGTV